MKTHIINKKQQQLMSFICLSFLSLSMIGCESSLSEVIPTENGAVLNIAISGIEEEINTALSNARSNNPSIEMTNEVATKQFIALGNTDIFTDSKIVQEANVRSTQAESNKQPSSDLRSSLGPQSATTVMTNGVRYRLIMFNQNNVLVVNQVLTSGTNPQIRVDGSRNYTWYALSLNETNAQVPDMNASGIIAKASLANRDVLYASGSISTVDGDNYLAIVFRRLTTRFRVRLDVRGLFGTVGGNTSLALLKNTNNTNLITMGDLNIRTGGFSSIDRYPNTVVTNAQMQNVEGTPVASTKYANFYTLDTEAITANNLKVVINRLDITLDNSSTRSFTTATTIPYANAYTPRIGTTYELTLGMVEQAIRVNGILWARTNLVYDATKTDSYRLKTTAAGSDNREATTDYWNWMSATPTGATSNTDPCSLIYPNGTWRMPTRNEWESIGIPDERRRQAYLLFGTQFAYVWTPDSDYTPNPAYDENNLFIAFGGYRLLSNVVVQSPAGILTIGSGQCHYWTSTPGNTSLTATAFQSSFSTIAFLFSWGALTYNDASRSEGRNIRCVRRISN